MDYVKLFKKAEEIIYQSVGRVSSIASMIFGILALIAVPAALFYFGVPAMIFAPDIPLYGQAFFVAFFSIFTMAMIGNILQGLIENMAYRNSFMSEPMRIMILARTATNSFSMILAGLVFVGFGIATIIHSLVVGIFVSMIGIFPILMGSLDFIKNYIFYKEHNREGVVPSGKYELVTAINDYTFMILFGVVFVMILPVMAVMSFATPDLETGGKIAVIVMGFIFACIGTAIIIFAIKKIKNDFDPWGRR